MICPFRFERDRKSSVFSVLPKSGGVTNVSFSDKSGTLPEQNYQMRPSGRCHPGEGVPKVDKQSDWAVQGVLRRRVMSAKEPRSLGFVVRPTNNVTLVRRVRP